MLLRVACAFLWMVVHTGCSWLSLARSPLSDQNNTFESRASCPQSYGCSGSRRSYTPSGFCTLVLSISFDQETGTVPHHHPLQVHGQWWMLFTLWCPETERAEVIFWIMYAQVNWKDGSKFLQRTRTQDFSLTSEDGWIYVYILS